MKKFYIHNGTEQMGPFDIDDLKSKDIHAETPIWYDGLDNWTTASKVDELKEILRTATPPPFNQPKTAPPPIPKVEPQSANSSAPIDLSGLSSYWVGEFTKIRESKEIYKGEWNTWAFLFGSLWFFVKGAWAMGIIYAVAGYFILDIENPFIGLTLYLIFLLYPGFKGNWIYYKVKIKKEQF